MVEPQPEEGGVGARSDPGPPDQKSYQRILRDEIETGLPVLDGRAPRRG